MPTDNILIVLLNNPDKNDEDYMSILDEHEKEVIDTYENIGSNQKHDYGCHTLLVRNKLSGSIYIADLNLESQDKDEMYSEWKVKNKIYAIDALDW